MENKILMPIEIKGQTFKNRIMFLNMLEIGRAHV